MVDSINKLKDILIVNDKYTKYASNCSQCVNYLLYSEEGDDINVNNIPKAESPKKVFANTNSACFAELISCINTKAPESNRMVYLMNSRGEYLPKGILDAWIKLCRKNKMVPDYLDDSLMLKRTPVYKFLDHSPSLLFIYLTAMRMVQEMPMFVCAMISLCYIHKIDFYTAWAIASATQVHNTNHNIVSIGKGYGYSDVADKAINLSYIRGLRRYLQAPPKFDTRTIRLANKKDYTYGKITFKAFNALVEAGELSTNGVALKNILDDDIQEVIHTDDTEKALSILKDSKVVKTVETGVY